MGHKVDVLKAVGLRLLIASPFFALQTYLIHIDPISGVSFGFIPGVIGALIVAPKFLDILAEPFRALLYPMARFDKPVPMYGVPKSMRAKGEYEDALRYYEDMEQKYPGDLEVYRNMLELLVSEMKDTTAASEVFQRALETLKTSEGKEGLARVYEGLLSQRKGKPDWLKEQQERVLRTSESDGAIVEEPDGYKRRRFHSGGYRAKE
jgi:tetratricopeptide (TPR) repeat protein